MTRSKPTGKYVLFTFIGIGFAIWLVSNMVQGVRERKADEVRMAQAVQQAKNEALARQQAEDRRTPEEKEAARRAAEAASAAAAKAEKDRLARRTAITAERVKIAAVESGKTCITAGSLLRKDPQEKVARTAAYLEAAVDDGGLKRVEIPDILARSVAVGMSECGLLATLGQPTRVNTTKNVHGESRQYVYDREGRRIYVHTNDDSRVTSVSTY